MMNRAYERVRVAIVQQAIVDYKKALKKKNGGSIKYFERWFLSEWGQALSGNNGEYIIDECRKCVGAKPKPRNTKFC